MADNEGHPAWQEILEVLPPEFHTLIKPTLLKWDQGVQEKIKTVHEQYAPYKEFADNNIDGETLKNGYNLLSNFQQNPGQVVQQAIEAFDLEYVSAEDHTAAVAQAEAAAGNNEDLDDYESLEDDPRLAKIMETVETLTAKLNEKDESERTKAEQKALDKTLEDLEETKGSFDKVYVMALMANGVPGEKAVEQYHNTINQAVEGKLKENNITLSSSQQDEAPIVMNGGGDAGSGLPVEPVDMGDLKEKDVNDLVVEMLSKSTE